MQDNVAEISPKQIKQFLVRYGEDAKALALMRERLSALEIKSGSAGISKLDGMPHSGGNPVDAVGRAVAALETLQAAVEDAETQLRDREQRTQAVIDLLRDARVKNWPEKHGILTLKYIDGASWADITDTLYSDEPSYLDRAETFQRKIFGLHRAALDELTQLAAPNMLDDYVD